MLKSTRQAKLILLSICYLFGFSAPAFTQQLDVPVMERANENLDTCAIGKIGGLKTDRDGFLAVRSGPAGNYAKIDELFNGDDVWLFEQKGQWIGIMYGATELSCGPIEGDRPVAHEGKKGWVHENWVELIAG